jgi:hypothetical protein
VIDFALARSRIASRAYYGSGLGSCQSYPGGSCESVSLEEDLVLVGLVTNGRLVECRCLFLLQVGDWLVVA